MRDKMNVLGIHTYHSLPELVGPTHGDVPLHGDGQGHVDRGAERDGGHRVKEVDIPCEQ